MDVAQHISLAAGFIWHHARQSRHPTGWRSALHGDWPGGSVHRSPEGIVGVHIVHIAANELGAALAQLQPLFDA